MKVNWRRFAFFKKEALAEEGELCRKLGCGSSDVRAAAYCELFPRADVAADGDDPEATVDAQCFFGADTGEVVAADADLAVCARIAAFGVSCAHVAAVVSRGRNCVVCAVGSDDGVKHLLRAWDYDAETRQSTEIEALDVGDSAPTCLSLRSDGSLAALGCASGAIVLVTLRKHKVAGMLRAATTDDGAVTNLVFRLCADAPATHLFATTDDARGAGEVVCYAVPQDVGARSLWSDEAKQKWRGSPRVLDNRGAAARCAAFDGEELVVARADGLYFYNEEERGGATGFDGEKHCVCCLAHGFVLVASFHEKSKRSEVHIYDVSNKRVAHFYRLAAGQNVRFAVGTPARRCAKTPRVSGDWLAQARRTSADPPPLCAALLVFSRGASIRLSEKPTAEKLDALFRMNLYPTAVEVAAKAKCKPQAIMDIYRMYGDHLYKKADWDGAVEQYGFTIGHVEPSYVIRRFLDAQRVGTLATYLELCHSPQAQAFFGDALSAEASSNFARPELTTLLVHCYAKLKDVSKLDALTRAGADDASLRFDARPAIEALRDAGFVEHALELAKKRNEVEWYVRVQFERRDASSQDLKEGLLLLGALPAATIERFMLSHGKKLVTDLPDDATELLMKLCTSPLDSSTEEARPAAESFSQLFVERPTYLRVLLEFVFRQDPRRASKELVGTLIELVLDDWAAARDALQSALRCDPLSSSAKAPTPVDESQRSDLEAKMRAHESDALALLSDDDASYDKYHALVLVETRRFEAGRLWLFENRLRRADDADGGPALPRGVVHHVLLEAYAARGDVRAMAKVCRTVRAEQPWLSLLRHAAEAIPERPRALGSGGEAQDSGGEAQDSFSFFEKSDELGGVIRIVDEEKALAPQRVIRECAGAPLDALRPYLLGKLEASFLTVKLERIAIADLHASTAAMRQEIHDLRVAAVHLMRHASPAAKSAAAATYGTPESALLPALAYGPENDGAADHGNDAADFADGEHHKWEQIKLSQEARAHDHEQFFKDLEDEDHGGFETVALYFGKGVIR